jgi:hypothetical protein
LLTIKIRIMKSNHILKYFLVIISILLLRNEAFAQDETEYDGYVTRLNLTYLKNSDDVKTLTCVISAKKGDLNQPVENAELKFYAGKDQSKPLGVKKTNFEGIATLEIDKNLQLPVDDSGAVLYRVEYKGLANSKDAEAEVSVVDVNIELKLEVLDSVKTVTVKATKIGKNNETIALAGQDIVVSVKRLYSNLKIGTITLDESGSGSTEYKTLPGDSAGNIKIIARIDGSEVYATVEKSQEINWGTKVSYNFTSTKRELWTNEAPLWMAITLSIFLLGVAYHLGRVFIKMRKIKKMGEEYEKISLK